MAVLFSYYDKHASLLPLTEVSERVATVYAPYAEKCSICRRQLSNIQKPLTVTLFYLTVYLLLSHALAPNLSESFVSDELRIGNKYVFMFLVSPKTPVFSDTDGAAVFTSRQCGRCFITNNKGLLPINEYDAVLVFGEWQTMAVIDPGKRYLIEADKRCVRNKLRGCMREPRVTSFTSRKTYGLCGLCRRLVEERSFM